VRDIVVVEKDTVFDVMVRERERSGTEGKSHKRSPKHRFIRLLHPFHGINGEEEVNDTIKGVINYK